MDSNKTVKIVCAIIDEPTIKKMTRAEEIEQRDRFLSELKYPTRPTREKYIKIVEQHTGPKSLFELSLQILRSVLTGKDLAKLPRDLIEKLKETIFTSFPIKTQIRFLSESKVYVDDIILSHYLYNKNDKLDGECIDYISKIRVKSTNYKNGKKNGMCVVWNDADKQREEKLYVNDVIKSHINYSYRGDVLYASHFKNGKLEGILEKYLKNTTEFYKNGIIQSRNRYFRNGNLYLKEVFQNGKLIEEHSFYGHDFLDSIGVNKKTFKNGKLVGECRGRNFQGSWIYDKKMVPQIKLSNPKRGLMITLNIILISCSLLFITVVLYNP